MSKQCAQGICQSHRQPYVILRPIPAKLLSLPGLIG
nr:MAG TPA: Nsp2-type cysteine proteinase [Caudoviricetes sp.]